MNPHFDAVAPQLGREPLNEDATADLSGNQRSLKLLRQSLHRRATSQIIS